MRIIKAYSSVHSSLRRKQGVAAQFACVDCGGPAQEWSYNGGSPDERSGFNSHQRPIVYSVNVADYSPRCRHCHRMLDPHPHREKTHCKHGHEYTPENTYIRGDGWRRCVACVRISGAKNKAKKKVAA